MSLYPEMNVISQSPKTCTHHKAIVLQDITLHHSPILLKQNSHIISLCVPTQVANKNFDGHPPRFLYTRREKLSSEYFYTQNYNANHRTCEIVISADMVSWQNYTDLVFTHTEQLEAPNIYNYTVPNLSHYVISGSTKKLMKEHHKK